MMKAWSKRKPRVGATNRPRCPAHRGSRLVLRLASREHHRLRSLGVARLKTAHRSRDVQRRPRTAGQVPIAGPAAARPLLVGAGGALEHCVRDSTLDCVQVCQRRGNRFGAGWEQRGADGVGRAIVEELIFRGAIFRLLWSGLGVWWALGLSSALFGATHLIKPGADLMAVLGIIFAGGVPMAALYLLTSRLWASIG